MWRGLGSVHHLMAAGEVLAERQQALHDDAVDQVAGHPIGGTDEESGDEWSGE